MNSNPYEPPQSAGVTKPRETAVFLRLRLPLAVVSTIIATAFAIIFVIQIMMLLAELDAPRRISPFYSIVTALFSIAFALIAIGLFIRKEAVVFCGLMALGIQIAIILFV